MLIKNFDSHTLLCKTTVSCFPVEVVKCFNAMFEVFSSPILKRNMENIYAFGSLREAGTERLVCLCVIILLQCFSYWLLIQWLTCLRIHILLSHTLCCRMLHFAWTWLIKANKIQSNIGKLFDSNFRYKTVSGVGRFLFVQSLVFSLVTKNYWCLKTLFFIFVPPLKFYF